MLNKVRSESKNKNYDFVTVKNVMSRPIENLGRTCYKNSALQLISRITTLIKFLGYEKGLHQYEVESSRQVEGNVLGYRYYYNLKMLLAINNGEYDPLRKKERIYRNNMFSIKFKELSNIDGWLFGVQCGQENDSGEFIESFLNYLYPSRFDNVEENIVIPDNVKGKCSRKIQGDNGKYLFKKGDPRYSFQYVMKNLYLDNDRIAVFKYTERSSILLVTEYFISRKKNEKVFPISEIGRRVDTKNREEWNGSDYILETHYRFSHYAIISIIKETRSGKRIELCSWDDEKNEYTTTLMHISGKLLKYRPISMILFRGEQRMHGDFSSHGHYIALVKHPFSDVWYEYNDESKQEAEEIYLFDLYSKREYKNYKAVVVLYECIEDNYDVNDDVNYTPFLENYIRCNEDIEL